jgi:hypothetical protein
MGVAMQDQEVSLETDFGTLSDASVITGEDGTATFTITSDAEGTATITATFGEGDDALTATATKEWYIPSADTLSLEPLTATNPVNTDHLLTVTLLDQMGLGMSDQEVSLETDFGTLSDTSVITGEDGTATFTITSDAEGTATITATFGEGDDALTATATKVWTDITE